MNKFHLEIGVSEWILAQGSEPKRHSVLIFGLASSCTGGTCV